VHPADLDLLRFARLPAQKRDPNDPVAIHVTGCDECREELLLMEEWLAYTNSQTPGQAVRSQFEETVLRLLQPRRSYVSLTLMDMPSDAVAGHSLAADGVTAPVAGLQHRATLYSEDPEVILRLMHDPSTGRDLLQLTANDPSLTKHVYIRLSDPPAEFLTDEWGRAEVSGQSLGDPAVQSWRLQLPDASFMLKPLEQPKAASETVIDLPGGDSVGVTILNDANGMSLRVRPLRIHGQESIERVRVVVCQSGGRWQAVDTRAPGECVAANLSSDSPIEIRLFVIE
jgi:hypothetical protein